MKIFLIYIVHLIVFPNIVLAQTWPVGTEADLSSAFGSRLDPNNNYDFHRGVDIGSTGNIFAAAAGTVLVKTTDLLIIADIYDEWERYFHISSTLVKDDIIEEGDIIGTVVGNHLDVKYHPYDYDDKLDARHPMGPVLPYSNDAGGEYQIDSDWTIRTDDSGSYVELAVSVDGDQLDLVSIELLLSAEDPTTGATYDEVDLLKGSMPKNKVDYNDRINAGDINSGIFVENWDNGFRNNGIQILPITFSKSDDAFTVNFRFYLSNEFSDLWSTLQGRAEAWDSGVDNISTNWFDII